jgi:hypothetical protein
MDAEVERNVVEERDCFANNALEFRWMSCGRTNKEDKQVCMYPIKIVRYFILFSAL